MARFGHYQPPGRREHRLNIPANRVQGRPLPDSAVDWIVSAHFANPCQIVQFARFENLTIKSCIMPDYNTKCPKSQGLSTVAGLLTCE